ncbi:MAG: ABC transporter ATP-binding protein [Propionibacteriaceae bacterium]|jgi:putative ABC transport system ATP-binding protein|nr:ABC transporter ATP-binding protein [Propionibacteriaceae bacterium]
MKSSPEDSLIELDQVTRDFGQVKVLKGISFTIRKGEYLAVTGPSGSGKSTLMNQMGLLDMPTSGHIKVKGQIIDQLSDAQVAALRSRTIGFVFQAFHLIDSRTALENVELGMLYKGLPRSERKERAIAALERVGLAHRMSAYPTTLSGGEQQRVAVARAVASDIDLLLADEPTGNLDSATTSKIMELFDQLHATGLTIALITHDLRLAKHALRNIEIADGQIVRDENHTARKEAQC